MRQLKNNYLRMKKNKQLGICMDHSTAYLMEKCNDLVVSNKIVIEPISREEDDNLERHEENEFNKEHQQHQSAFYKKIGELIRNYDEVILFGPTDAKNELLNRLRKDHHFENVRIVIENTQMMTESQMQSYFKAFYKW
jgi:hypothetical protein